MSSLSESIQRARYMNIKGHNDIKPKTRDIKADRVLCAKLSRVKSVTKEPAIVTNLYKLLGE